MRYRVAAAAILLLLASACATKEPPELEYRAVDRNPPKPQVAFAKPPPMDPARKVAAQDCSKPVTEGSGNLRCL